MQYRQFLGVLIAWKSFSLVQTFFGFWPLILFKFSVLFKNSLIYLRTIMRHSLVEFVGKRWSLFQAQNFVALTLAQKRKSSRCATMFIRCHDKLSSIEEKTKKCGRLNLARHWCICWTNQNETLKGPSQLHFISSITPLFSHFFCFHTELKKKTFHCQEKIMFQKIMHPLFHLKLAPIAPLKPVF